MRHQGTIVSWDLGRGIGAIQWHGGDERVFVRVTDFPEGIRRPEVGDVVTYFRGSDERGRPIASIVEYATVAGQHPPLPAVHAAAARARIVPDPVARAPAEHVRHADATAQHVRHADATAQAETPSFARAAPGPASPWPRVAVALVVLVLIVVVAWILL